MQFSVKRILSLLTAIFEGGIFSGVLIGWSSLVYILKQEGDSYFLFYWLNIMASYEAISRTPVYTNSGFFRDNCPAVNVTSNFTTECSSQNSEMNQIYTISAVICNFSTFFFGYLMDKWGTWVSSQGSQKSFEWPVKFCFRSLCNFQLLLSYMRTC